MRIKYFAKCIEDNLIFPGHIPFENRQNDYWRAKCMEAGWHMCYGVYQTASMDKIIEWYMMHAWSFCSRVIAWIVASETSGEVYQRYCIDITFEFTQHCILALQALQKSDKLNIFYLEYRWMNTLKQKCCKWNKVAIFVFISWCLCSSMMADAAFYSRTEKDLQANQLQHARKMCKLLVL